MAVAPIGAGQPAPFVPPKIDSAGATEGAGKSAFARGLDSMQALQDNADGLAAQVASGDVQDIHQFTVAAAKANLAVELTTAIRNKAVEAYQDIMRMQV
jgi:flagellar hook-basal body complex protein FliE